MAYPAKEFAKFSERAISHKKLSPEQAGPYLQMREPIWWSKNLISTYAISKADVKDLANISKDLDSASTTILSLNISAEASAKERSLYNV